MYTCCCFGCGMEAHMDRYPKSGCHELLPFGKHDVHQIKKGLYNSTSTTCYSSSQSRGPCTGTQTTGVSSAPHGPVHAHPPPPCQFREPPKHSGSGQYLYMYIQIYIYIYMAPFHLLPDTNPAHHPGGAIPANGYVAASGPLLGQPSDLL